MTSFKKSLVGGAAGLCLVLVKLIQAGFYLDPSIQLVEVWGGLLTSAAFVVLAMIFTTFLEETDPRKLFMQGLAAPSFLIALAQPPPYVPPNGTGDESTLSIPDLPLPVLLFPLTAHAEEEDSATEDGQRFQVQTISKEMFEGSLGDGVLRFVGRTPTTTYAYVIGKTRHVKQAQKLAEMYDKLLDGQTVHLLQPQGSRNIYLSIGNFGGPQTVSAERTRALEKLQDTQNLDWKYIAPLVNGRAVSLRKISERQRDP